MRDEVKSISGVSPTYRGDAALRRSLPEFDLPPGAADTRPDNVSRRDFLRLTGFTAASAVLWQACARPPVEKAIPHLIPVEEAVLGESTWQSGLCGACSAGCGLRVKLRDGRPVMLEGNSVYFESNGGLCPAGQASLIGLYDSHRLGMPLAQGRPTTPTDAKASLNHHWTRLRASGGGVRLLTGDIASPTALSLIDKFLKSFADGRMAQLSSPPIADIRNAHRRTHGRASVPDYRFDRAEMIVSFGADFLGSFLSPVRFAADYAARRDPDRADPPAMSRHVQFESLLTITGAKADERYPLSPDQIHLTLLNLARDVASLAGDAFPLPNLPEPPVDPALVQRLAKELVEYRGRSLVLCGQSDVSTQVCCNYINTLLDNYGGTIRLREQPEAVVVETALATLIEEMESGAVAALIVVGTNPVAELPGRDRIVAALKKVPLVVQIAAHSDETTPYATYVLPESHFLETWSDTAPSADTYAIGRPAVKPWGESHSLIEYLSSWVDGTGEGKEILRRRFQSNVLPHLTGMLSADAAWEDLVGRGCVRLDQTKVNGTSPVFDRSALTDLILPDSIALAQEKAEHFDPPQLALYEAPHFRGWGAASNPYLYELPDPISKVTWDNVALIGPKFATTHSLRNGDLLAISPAEHRAEPIAIEIPCFVLPGMAEGVVAVALHYGSEASRRFAKVGPQWLFGKDSTGPDGRVGVNAAPLLGWKGGDLSYEGRRVGIRPVGRRIALACTQEHFDLAERENDLPAGTHLPEIVISGTLDAYRADPASLVGHPSHEGYDLWPDDHPTPVHRWGMAIDLNKCTGCSACIVGCNIENNIPIVGRDEVRRNREMHWLRIDRYYRSDGRDSQPNSPDVVFMPVMCQQCAHAPCETVCPVLATTHSSEGLNQQTYNRCVGTRYCANNCPYKTRRFNWFDYPQMWEKESVDESGSRQSTERERLLLNPDVTVRSRGVMEKCTFCIQRIMDAKARAKSAGQPVKEGDIQPACAGSCPARAIVFGDLNDPASAVSLLWKRQRAYHLLEELNVRPSVAYLAEVRNREGGAPAGDFHHSTGDSHHG
ncbi:MAG: 4Fe-4S dicluster domain-containing protein [Calditrichaeota bacterium]|nr:4Fe-4S dicluster domain-containing protein [Calditrichota bacterium]